ncbi:hypothetical protein D3C80_835770 [compost metagenome]
MQVGAHAHADEEQPQQQALEGFDLRFQLVTVFRVGQQQAGEESAKGHGDTRFFHQPGGADHHQQCGGSRHFRQAGAGHGAEHWAQQVATADDHHGDAGEYLQAVLQAVALAGVRATGGQQRYQGDQRDRGDVLEQQDGERQTAVRGIELFVLCQALQAKGG